MSEALRGDLSGQELWGAPHAAVVPRRREPRLEPIAPLTTEFGWLHARTAEVAASFDHDHRLIAACTGSANPAMLKWMVTQLDAQPDEVVLDLGAGLGGPTRWLARHTRASVLGLDVLEDSVRGMRTLFPGVPGVVARVGQLPFPDASVDHVVAVGVLDQVPSLGHAAASIARVLRPGGRLVAAFYVSDLPVAGGPEANRFRTAGAHLHPFHEAGFDSVHLESFADLPIIPDLWRRVRAAVDHEVADRHGADPRYQAAIAQKQRFHALEGAGVISLRGLTATRGDG